ncbi:MAG: ATP-binding protein [Thiovulaceae bacterium]|nr:ATP-binding protein [Sulfurimonadaceae bacterium]
MLVNLQRAIQSITEKIGFFQPLYEAIINSFQANANNIEISFIKDEHENILGYKIKDDGDGFTDENIKSYLTLWSDYKIKLGALGSGRIMCLKVFDDILVESQTKNTKNLNGQKVKFDFNKNFTANSIEEIDKVENASTTSYTYTTFQNINEEYIKQNGHEKYDIEKIKNDLFIKLLPMFIRFKNEEKIFSISIEKEKWLNEKNLKERFDEHNFLNKDFCITVDLSKFDKENNDIKNEKTYTFDLLYRVQKDDKNTLEQFYGASDRYIKEFAKGVRLEKLDSGYSGIFCLTSDYFEENRVKDSRNEFVIGFGESNPTKENPITFPEINELLRKKLDEILKETFPQVEENLEKRKQKIIEQFPHLTRYVNKIENLTISESNILKKAEKEFFEETKKVRKEVKKFTDALKKDKTNFSEKKFKEITSHFTEVGREQLADYIGYRQTIIDMLIEIYDETSKNKSAFKEKDIHNLFMPKGNTSQDLFTYANNVWIFDDKFMSYNYCASDKTIAKIVSDVTGKTVDEVIKHHRNQEPDLVMFYSNQDSEYKDVLLIEFKRLNNELSEKKKAIMQLQDYPMYIRKNIENVRSIFSYTIIDIDEPFREWLTDSQTFDEYSFGDSTNKISSFYKYISGKDGAINAHLNVIEFFQVLQDANKRNQVFLDILKQTFNVNNNGEKEQ